MVCWQQRLAASLFCGALMLELTIFWFTQMHVCVNLFEVSTESTIAECCAALVQQTTCMSCLSDIEF